MMMSGSDILMLTCGSEGIGGPGWNGLKNERTHPHAGEVCVLEPPLSRGMTLRAAPRAEGGGRVGS